MSKLLTCPFCGSDARLIDLKETHPEVEWKGRYFIECSNPICNVRCSTKRHHNKKILIKLWNKRL